MTLDDLLTLPGATLDATVAAVGADPATRESVRGYQALTHVDAIEAPDGATVYARGDEVKLVYLGPDALPGGVSHASLTSAVGADGQTLRSRQGKSALMHVVAPKGVAWSEDGDEVGFIEVFPPTTFEAYRREIYRRPALFRR